MYVQEEFPFYFPAKEEKPVNNKACRHQCSNQKEMLDLNELYDAIATKTKTVQ